MPIRPARTSLIFWCTSLVSQPFRIMGPDVAGHIGLPTSTQQRSESGSGMSAIPEADVIISGNNVC